MIQLCRAVSVRALHEVLGTAQQPFIVTHDAVSTSSGDDQVAARRHHEEHKRRHVAPRPGRGGSPTSSVKGSRSRGLQATMCPRTMIGAMSSSGLSARSWAHSKTPPREARMSRSGDNIRECRCDGALPGLDKNVTDHRCDVSGARCTAISVITVIIVVAIITIIVVGTIAVAVATIIVVATVPYRRHRYRRFTLSSPEIIQCIY